MYKLDYRDLLAGAILIIVGLSVAIFATAEYEIGTPRQMGPGMFPVALGYLLAILGVAIMGPALFRGGAPLHNEVRPLLACLVGILLFALTIERVGLLVAIFALVLCSAMANKEVRIKSALLLATCLALMGVAIFVWGLGVPMSIVKGLS